MLVLVVGLIGFLEMLGGYKGWSGVRGLAERKLKDDINFIKKVKGELEYQGYLDELKFYFYRKYFRFLNNEEDISKEELGLKKNLLNRLVDWTFKNTFKIVKTGGYLGIFILGVTPIPGFRVIPDIFCGTMRWKMGFTVLAIGNFLKTVAFIYGWSWLLT